MRPSGFPRGWKNSVSISIAFCLDFCIGNENITSEECKAKTVWNNIAWKASYNPSKLGGEKIMSRSNPYKWMFYFWLPFQLWRLVTRPTFNVISNSLLLSISRKLYFYYLFSQSKNYFPILNFSIIFDLNLFENEEIAKILIHYIVGFCNKVKIRHLSNFRQFPPRYPLLLQIWKNPSLYSDDRYRS